MPYFLIEYRQVGSDADRETHRAAHIAFRKGKGGSLKVAGSLLDEEGSPIGSLVLFEADDRAAAMAFAQGDPMLHGGVFELVSVRPFRVAAINPL